MIFSLVASIQGMIYDLNFLSVSMNTFVSLRAKREGAYKPALFLTITEDFRESFQKVTEYLVQVQVQFRV